MRNQVFQKVIKCGLVEYDKFLRKVEIELNLYDTDNGLEFSASGHIGNVLCGQCIDEIAKLLPDNKKVQRINEIWSRWHLNGLHAGCVHQREFEKEPYEKHAGAHCDICNYTYGTKWLHEDLPEDIVAEIKNM